MAENKSRKIGRNNGSWGENTLFISVGMGAMLLVLAEIGCILAGIYSVFSLNGAVVVITVTAVLLLVATGVFLYILKNVVFTKMEEQNQLYEELIRISKGGSYGSIDGSSSGMDEGGPQNIAERIREDVERIQKEQGEALYKRQMSIANVQIKRTKESVMNMVRANEYIIEVMEEKLGADSILASQGTAIEELRQSVNQLCELCERMAGEQESVPVPEEEAAGVDIEPLPEDVLENIDMPEIESIEPELENIDMPEMEELGPETAFELEPEEEEELTDLEPEEPTYLEPEEPTNLEPEEPTYLEPEEPTYLEPEEPTDLESEEPEDSDRPMTAEEIEAMLNNL